MLPDNAGFSYVSIYIIPANTGPQNMSYFAYSYIWLCKARVHVMRD